MKTSVLFAALLVGGICSFPSAARAQKKVGEAVKVHETKIKGSPSPGGEVIAVIAYEIEEGYHVHSNKPSEPNFIATALTVEAPKGVAAGTPVYPKGKSQKVEGLAKPLSVYEGQFTISVPLKLDASVQLPLKLSAGLRYQACQGAQCYAPKTLKAEVPIPAK